MPTATSRFTGLSSTSRILGTKARAPPAAKPTPSAGGGSSGRPGCSVMARVTHQKSCERRSGLVRIAANSCTRSESAVVIVARTQHDEPHAGPARVIANALRQLDAVHARHLIVQQRQVEARPVGVEHGERCALGFRGDDLDAPRIQMLPQYFPIAGVVVDDERVQADQPHPRQAGQGRRRLDHRLQPHLEPEYRAAADHAVDADLAAHQRRQFAADGQPQARAAVFARRE